MLPLIKIKTLDERQRITPHSGIAVESTRYSERYD